MKKTCIAVLTILILLLCFAAETALADKTTVVMNTDGEETTLARYIDGKNTIVVFGRTTCSRTKGFISGLSAGRGLMARYGLQAVAVMDTVYSDPTPEELAEFAAQYPGVTVLKQLNCYNSSFYNLETFNNYTNALYREWRKELNGHDVSLYPMVFLRDAGGMLLDFSSDDDLKTENIGMDPDAYVVKAVSMITGNAPVYELRVRFLWINDDSELQPDKVLSFQAGESYSVSIPEFDGFTALRQEISGTMPAKDLEIVVYYENNASPYPEPEIHLEVDREKFTPGTPFTVSWRFDNMKKNDGTLAQILFRLHFPYGSKFSTTTYRQNLTEPEGTISWTIDDPDVERLTILIEIYASETREKIAEASVGMLSELYRLSGDVNADGEVDGRDALRLMKYLSGEEDAAVDERNADVNQDGETNELDLLALIRYLSGQTDALQ